MVIINIPSKDLLEALYEELKSKYGWADIKRRFAGFRVSTGNTPVVVVNTSNIRYVAWRINKEAQKHADCVTEIFRDNSAFWHLGK